MPVYEYRCRGCGKEATFVVLTTTPAELSRLPADDHAAPPGMVCD